MFFWEKNIETLHFQFLIFLPYKLVKMITLSINLFGAMLDSWIVSYGLQFGIAIMQELLIVYLNLFVMKFQVTPLVTFVLVLLSLVPCLVKAWRNPQPRMITRWVAYAYTCGFLFGWHVHEKASLHFVIPLAIVAIQSKEDASHYFLLSIGIFLTNLLSLR